MLHKAEKCKMIALYYGFIMQSRELQISKKPDIYKVRITVR